MLTYETARDMMKGARNGRRKLGNNTWLEERVPPQQWAGEMHGTGVHYAVRLHSTDVVTFHPDGSITLDSGRWRTVTTKDRINAHCTAQVWSDRGEWKVRIGKGWSEDRPSYDFADGMTIYPSGKVEGAGRDLYSVRKMVLRLVKKYVDGYAESVSGIGLTQPSSGDCWGCCMTDDKAKSRPPGHRDILGVDHYASHFEEEYYVPSLLWRALQGRGDPAFCWNWWNERAKKGDVQPVKDDLRRFFKPLIPVLVEYYANRQMNEASAA